LTLAATAWYAVFGNIVGCGVVCCSSGRCLGGGWQACRRAAKIAASAKRRLLARLHVSDLNFTSFFPSRFTPPITLVSGPTAKDSRNTGLQLPAKMPRRLMAYIDVSGGRPGWPADDQVYTHLLKARPAVVARAATRRPYQRVSIVAEDACMMQP